MLPRLSAVAVQRERRRRPAQVPRWQHRTVEPAVVDLLSAPSDKVGFLVLKGCIAGCADIRTQARFGDGNLLVGGTQICPLRIQHRIDQIGVRQRLDQRFGRNRARAENGSQGKTRDGRRPATPPRAFRAGLGMPALDACHLLKPPQSGIAPAPDCDLTIEHLRREVTAEWNSPKKLQVVWHRSDNHDDRQKQIPPGSGP